MQWYEDLRVRIVMGDRVLYKKAFELLAAKVAAEAGTESEGVERHWLAEALKDPDIRKANDFLPTKA